MQAISFFRLHCLALGALIELRIAGTATIGTVACLDTKDLDHVSATFTFHKIIRREASRISPEFLCNMPVA